MPQLDKVTLFSQVFWLLVLYFTFFVIFINFYLPQFSKVFKIRSFLLGQDTLTAEIVANRLVPLVNSITLILSHVLQVLTIKTLPRMIQQYRTQWIILVSTSFKKANSLFLKSYLVNGIKFNLSKKIYF